MRHIPEDELHAYLDQALSRSQCVEIESHLAGCLACRSLRDMIAALRDRTTALLATLSPDRATPPPFELIEARRAAAAARRHHLVRRVAWAASLVAAVGAGWGLNQLADDRPAAGHLAAATAELPERPAAPAQGAANTARPIEQGGGAPDAASTRTGDPGALPTPPSSRSATPRALRNTAAAASGEARFVVPSRLQNELADRGDLAERFAAPRSLQVSSSGLPQGLALDGLWRTVSWENAQEEAGGAPAHVDGLPVVQVQVQQASSGKPLMVVAQQLGSGDVIRTIEGPAADVSSLLRGTTQPGSSPWPTVEPGDGGASTATDGSIVTMQGDRILAISAPGMSADSLAAMARRVNAGRR